MERPNPKSYFMDMDGVLMRGAAPIPGAADFVGRLEECGAKFLLLTNNSMYTPCALQLRLENSGLRVPSDAMRTALNAIDAHSEDSVMIGDNMDTDIIMGLESVLVLSGVTRHTDVGQYS